MKKLFLLAFLLILPALSFAQSGHQVGLAWIKSSDADANPTLNYNVYRADKLPNGCPATPDASFKRIATGIGSVTYTDLGVNPGSYCYYVTAALNGAESVPSNLAPAVVLPAPPSLQPPVAQ